MISQTSGHGDFRFLFEFPRKLGGPLSNSELEESQQLLTAPMRLRLRAREQLRHGASQIKLMAAAALARPFNPIESIQFTEPEIRAAVEACRKLGHLRDRSRYMPRAIRQAIAAGVKCIEQAT
jgi:imidazolonepropionase-like amidohydrolase